MHANLKRNLEWYERQEPKKVGSAHVQWGAPEMASLLPCPPTVHLLNLIQVHSIYIMHMVTYTTKLMQS